MTGRTSLKNCARCDDHANLLAACTIEIMFTYHNGDEGLPKAGRKNDFIGLLEKGSGCGERQARLL